MSVTVSTPTTQTLLDALRKDEFNTFVKNLTLFRQIYPNEPVPVSQDELYEMMGEAYGFDIDNVTGVTEGKKNRIEAATLIDAIRKLNPKNVSGENGPLPSIGLTPFQPSEKGVGQNLENPIMQ